MKKRLFANPGIPRTAFWLSAIFAGLCAFVAASLLKDDVPTDRVASVQRLVEQYDAVVFYRDFEPGVSRPRLYKWKQPLIINLKGAVGSRYEEIVKKHASELSRLTGLPFLVIQTRDDSGNVFLRFVLQSAMRSVVSEYEPNADKLESIVNSAACLLIRWYDVGVGATSRAVAIIPIDYVPDRAPECVLEELTHSFGLPHNSELIQPSVFATEDTPNQQHTINDKILIRTHYDDRISLGMPRAEALEMARTVITELVAKVKAEGESALYQPMKYEN